MQKLCYSYYGTPSINRHFNLLSCKFSFRSSISHGSSSRDRNSLRINEAQKSDAGAYQCRASSTHATAQDVAYVTLSGKPKRS